MLLAHSRASALYDRCRQRLLPCFAYDFGPALHALAHRRPHDCRDRLGTLHLVGTLDCETRFQHCRKRLMSNLSPFWA